MIKKTLILGIILIFSFSCKNKEYKDYKAEDFHEVQGIITSVKPTSDPFDGSRMRNISYIYLLEHNPPMEGFEKNIDLYLDVGQPVIVLVHKEDNKINFYGSNGVIDISKLNIGYEKIKKK